MKRKPPIEHLEDSVILAYLDGELSPAAARKAKHHLQSCWNCRSTAAELELLAQTAYALLSSEDDADKAKNGNAKAEFIRRKARIDEIRHKELRRSTSISFQRPVSSVGREGVHGRGRISSTLVSAGFLVSLAGRLFDHLLHSRPWVTCSTTRW